MHRWTSRTSRHLSRILATLILTTAAVITQAQFDLQDSHTTASLRGVHSLGGGIAWASGTGGTVLRTEDGGYLWQGCATPPGAEKLDFRGIQAFDENTAIVMSSGKGDLSRLYKTTDGCRTWKLLLTNPDKEGFWDALLFNRQKPISPSPDWQAHLRGFLVGDPVAGKFVIYNTIDSGTTWQRWSDDKNEHPAKANSGEGIFAASNSAAVNTGRRERLAFVTGGTARSHLFLLDEHDPFDARRWLAFTRTPLPMPSGDSAGCFSAAVRAIEHPGYVEADLVVVGGDYRKPEQSGAAAYIPARNYSWFGLFPQRVIASQTPPHGYRSSVAYDPKTNTWITTGPNGTDISRDDGKNWTALKPGPGQPADTDKNWNALSLPFVVGPHGRIGKLRDDALPTAQP